jgi:hypothetical protein
MALKPDLADLHGYFRLGDKETPATLVGDLTRAYLVALCYLEPFLHRNMYLATLPLP